MGRPPEFSDEDIIQKFEEMSARHQRDVSPWAVRDALGSAGKLSRVRDVIEAHVAARAPQSPKIELPTALQSELHAGFSALLIRVYQHATEVADARAAETATIQQTKIRSLQTELEQASAVIETAEDQIEQQGAEIDRLRQAEQILQQQVSAAEALRQSAVEERQRVEERLTGEISRLSGLVEQHLAKPRSES